MSTKFSTLSLSVLFLTTSCFNSNKKNYFLKQCNNQDNTYATYQKCDLTDVKNYYDVIVDNSKKSNKVILFLQDGATFYSLGGSFKNLFKKDDKHQYNTTRSVLGDEISNLIETIKASDTSFYLINQTPFLKQNKFSDGDLSKLTYEQGKKEHLENVNNLNNVIASLKKANKQIGLVGHLYGSLILNDYLVKYGDDKLSYALAINGRVKVKNQTKIKNAWDIAFSQDHRKVLIKENDEVDDTYNQEFIKQKLKPYFTDHYQKNEHIIYYKVGLRNLLNDYTKAIEAKTLSKTKFLLAKPNYTYGSFSDEETSWLKSKKANVKVFSQNDVKTIFEKNYPKQKDNQYAFKNFAQHVSMWNKQQIQEYYLNAFNK